MCEWGTTFNVLIHKKDGIHVVSVDYCISNIVQTLNDGGIETVASCCGHGKQPGNIALADGRELIISPDYETSRKIHSAFPPINPI